MSRKSSLYEISKAYEEVLKENALNEMEVRFVAPKPAEQMADIVNKADIEKENCPECKGLDCYDGEEDCEDCGCSDCGNDGGGHDVQEDSNLEMAKSEVYKIVKGAQHLMELLNGSKSLEPWMLSKLVKAADYICSVRGAIDYDQYEGEVEQPHHELSNGMHLVGKITQMLSGEGKEVNEQVIRRAIFNLELLKNK